MSWHDLLFAHYRIDAGLLRPLIPAALGLDLFDGSALLGVVPFYMRDVTLAHGPAIRGISDFGELNIQTSADASGEARSII